MPEEDRTTKQPERTELDRVIDYCDEMARDARRSKAKGGPNVLQALSLHRIACALEAIQEETVEEMYRQAQAAADGDELPNWAKTDEEIDRDSAEGVEGPTDDQTEGES